MKFTQLIMIKSITTLTLNVTEPDYRKLPGYSYSLLASFHKNGPNILIDPQFVETTATRNGSLFDTLLTEPETLNDRFYIGEFPIISDNLRLATTQLFNAHPTQKLMEIPQKEILDVLDAIDYGKTWKPETRIAKLYEAGLPFYNILLEAQNRTIISQAEYDKAQLAKTILLERPATRNLFLTNPFDTDIEAICQAKFTTTLNGIQYRCMFDRLIVNHSQKTIIPIDLKTTGHNEESFESSFLSWRYDIQGTLYYDILADIISKDEYFKDFKILPFRFVVIHVPNPNPIVWIMPSKEVLYNILPKHKYPSYSELAEQITWHHQNQVYNCLKQTFENDYIRNITLDFIK